jgi:capsular polysaccharide biosynthesis protein
MPAAITRTDGPDDLVEMAFSLIGSRRFDECERVLRLNQAHEASHPVLHYLYLVVLHQRLAVLEPEFSDVDLTAAVLHAARRLIWHGLEQGTEHLVLAAITALPQWLCATAEGRALLRHGMMALRQPMDNSQFLQLLGAWLLAKGDFDTAESCARRLLPDSIGAWRRFSLSPSLPRYCEAHRLPCLPSCQEVMEVVGSRLHSTQTTFLCNLPEGGVLGHSWLPVSADGHIFLAGCLHNPFRVQTSQKPEQLNDIVLASRTHVIACTVSAARHAGEFALLGGHHNFGHWLLNHFARLMFTDRHPAGDRLRFVIHDDLPATARQMLIRAGIAPERLHPVSRNSLPTFESLWVPAMPFGADPRRRLVWLPSALHFIRHRLRLSFDAPRTRRVFISRATARRRRLTNENEIISALQPYGFEVCDPGQMDLEQQIALAASTQVLVTPFGAGSNLHVFCATGVPVIELQHPHTSGTMDLVASSTDTLGQPYRRLIGQVSEKTDQPLDSDFIVPVELVIQAVADALMAL